MGLTRKPKGNVAMIAGLAMQINLHAAHPSALALPQQIYIIAEV